MPVCGVRYLDNHAIELHFKVSILLSVSLLSVHVTMKSTNIGLNQTCGHITELFELFRSAFGSIMPAENIRIRNSFIRRAASESATAYGYRMEI